MVIITRLRSFFNIITSSIAFYPTLYALSAVTFGFIMKYAESQGISRFLQKNIPALVVNDTDTARNILTTLIAGGLSMLVFSFSMVMLLLSQAAANYSPRVLPSLISNRRHQAILGTFLATILYNIITIIGVESKSDNYHLPGFSVLIGILSAVIALGAFVYFIHSISSSIQINNILRNIYLIAQERLQFLMEGNQNIREFPDTEEWHEYSHENSGTIQNISIPGLKEFVKMTDTKIELLITKGQYVHINQPLVKSEKNLIKRRSKSSIKILIILRQNLLVITTYLV